MEENFYQDGMVMVTFALSDCEACADFKIELDKAKSTIEKNNVKMIEPDLEQNEQLGLVYGAAGTPHSVIFKDGRIRATLPGFAEADHLADWIDSVANDRPLKMPEMTPEQIEKIAAEMREQGIDPAEAGLPGYAPEK